jgi:hypothetical protein
MKFWRRRWLLRWSAVAFAAAAFAPAAQATYHPEVGGGSANKPVAQQPAPTPVAVSDEFSWADAGVGAAAAFSVILVAGGGVLLVRGGRTGRLAGT